MFKSEFEREYTWLNGFMRNVYRFADKEAMISPETKTAWTYSELNSEANRFSNAILEAGIIKRRSSDVPTFELPGICVCIYRLS